VGRDRLARYSLTSPENDAAVELGLAGGAWFRSSIPRKRMKELMRRSDFPALRDTAIWFGLIVGFASLGIAFWGTWQAVPFLAAYGVLHEEVKRDCAPAYPSMWAAYKEIVSAVLRQLRDQEYYIRRDLLPGAAPYNEPVSLADGRALPLARAVAA